MQFLLFPQYFQKLSVVDEYLWSKELETLYKKPFENIVGKGENAGNQHFPTMFSTLSKTGISI